MARSGVPLRGAVAKSLHATVPDGVEAWIHDVQHLRRPHHRVGDGSRYPLKLGNRQDVALAGRLDPF